MMYVHVHQGAYLAFCEEDCLLGYEEQHPPVGRLVLWDRDESFFRFCATCHWCGRHLESRRCPHSERERQRSFLWTHAAYLLMPSLQERAEHYGQDHVDDASLLEASVLWEEGFSVDEILDRFP